MYRQKETTMNNSETYNRTTLNGTEWIVERGFLGGFALYMKNYKGDWQFSGYTFKTMEDAVKHLDEIDYKVSRPIEFKPCEVPADYYGVRGRYYGD